MTLLFTNYKIILSFLVLVIISVSVRAEQPNVIVILTDDQGYADIGIHGNPWLKTPAMDELANQSVRFSDFHVDPTCSPTRAALMTGKYSTKVGVWLTYGSRHHLAKNEVTMADAFQQNGYKTAIFGKWHLGDNYPFRPQDRGFDESLIHGGGSIGEAPDFWGNDTYNDVYFRNGAPEQTKGYATDIWFDETISFISKNQQNPFFVYLPLNAAHSPLNVPEKYTQPYLNNPDIPARRAKFYGMLANVDENLQKLRVKLKQLRLDQNTIILFLTDNGTGHGVKLKNNKGRRHADGWKKDGFNAGLRGKKSSAYEGGHRAALFMHWQKGGLNTGEIFKPLTAHFDLMPTLIEMCDLKLNKNIIFDGMSLLPYLKNAKTDFPKRTLFVHHQGRSTKDVAEGNLIAEKDYSVMTDQWRMVGQELFDIKSDPSQKIDVSAVHPKVAKQLQSAYQGWWQKIEKADDSYTPFIINPEKQKTVMVTTQNLMGGPLFYSQHDARSGKLATNGYVYIDVEKPGEYQITLRRWPRELDLTMHDNAPEFEINSKVHDQDFPFYQALSQALNIKQASIKVGNLMDSQVVKKGDKEVSFVLNLASGEQKLQSEFTLQNGQQTSAYYTYIERVE